MKMSLNQLRIKQGDLEKEYNDKIYKLKGNKLNLVIKEMDGHEEVMSAEFDFEAELEKIKTINKNIVKIKSTVAKCNNSFEVDEEHTIQSALIKLQELRKLYGEIDYIISNSRESKIRKNDGSMSSASYYEQRKLNFDEQSLKEYRDKLRDDINNLEVKVQEANNKLIDVEFLED